MQGEIILSSAYFPNIGYFSLIKNASSVSVETEENYIKQTYRNRCRILSSDKIQTLSVPVMKGGSMKTPIKDITIDYSKRWQQVHKRAITSSYGRAPYFNYYYEEFEKIIMGNHKYLIDLNDKLLLKSLEFLSLKKIPIHTSSFQPAEGAIGDFRYSFSPKTAPSSRNRPYIQVFSQEEFIPDLSIIDLIFNEGPESFNYI